MAVLQVRPFAATPAQLPSCCTLLRPSWLGTLHLGLTSDSLSLQRCAGSLGLLLALQAAPEHPLWVCNAAASAGPAADEGDGSSALDADSSSHEVCGPEFSLVCYVS